jgi:hypothetical protein
MSDTISNDELKQLSKTDSDLKFQLESDFPAFLLVLALVENKDPMSLAKVQEYIRGRFYGQINDHLKKLYEAKNTDRAEEQWERKLQVKISSHWNDDVNAFVRAIVDRVGTPGSYQYKLSENARYFCYEFLKDFMVSADKRKQAGNESLQGESFADFKIFFGPPGTGKTNKVKRDHLSKMPEKNYCIVQVHPSFSYEDLVEGIKPVTFFNGEIKYEIVNGPVKIMAHKARKLPVRILCCLDKAGNLHLPLGTQARYGFTVVNATSGAEDITKARSVEVVNDVIKDYAKNESGSDSYLKVLFLDKTWGDGGYAIVLDEINRGHVASILGELVFALSEAQSDDQKPVSLQFSNESFIWPSNLSFFATMNTADTTTDRLDQAIKRRFKMVKVDPFKTEDEWQKNLKLASLDKVAAGATVKDAFVKIFEDEAATFYPWKLLKEINDKLLEYGKKYGAICAEEKQIGHSFFIKYVRLVLDHYLVNKTLTKKDHVEHARKILRNILVEEVFPALDNVFNFNRDKAKEFIQDHILQAGAFNTLEQDVEDLYKKYEDDLKNAA